MGSTNLLPINKMELRVVIQTIPKEIPLQLFYLISNVDEDREERKVISRQVEKRALDNC
jgi:hypothetical protein